ncbi:NAD(P)-dependent oxidoreductase [Variovorax sp. LT1R16]|uniref:NAD(P)-dependent oxidoreductase n=1 Tax=Variovorax sp. LT1R16 TaxID=3443728 RepID=UPI003F44612D
MAEATIMLLLLLLLLLVLLYRLRETEAQMRGALASAMPPRSMLKARKVGIVGSGGIARQIVHRLAAWEVDLQMHTRAESADLAGVRQVGLHELLATSDVVVLMTSLDAGTRRLLNAETIRRLKPGVILINAARGGLIEEVDLVDALKSGHIAAAALDVFQVEPLPASHPLRELSNVILTQHTVGHTQEMGVAIPRTTVSNALKLLGGELPDSCRNREVAERWHRV